MAFLAHERRKSDVRSILKNVILLAAEKLYYSYGFFFGTERRMKMRISKALGKIFRCIMVLNLVMVLLAWTDCNAIMAGQDVVNNGHIEQNDSLMTTNNGTVDRNVSTVTTNNGSIVENRDKVVTNSQTGTIDNNWKDVTTNDGTLEMNRGGEATVGTNNGSIENNENIVNTNYGTVNINGYNEAIPCNGVIGANHGTVNTNWREITENCSDGTVDTNYGTIPTNNGTVNYNYSTYSSKATIAVNNGTVTSNNGTITDNDGTVTDNSNEIVNNAGIVENNNYTIKNNTGTVINNWGADCNNTGSGSVINYYCWVYIEENAAIDGLIDRGFMGKYIKAGEACSISASGDKIELVNGDAELADNGDGTYTLTVPVSTLKIELKTTHTDEIMDGNNQYFEHGSDSSIRIECSGNYADCTDIMVDGEKVDKTTDGTVNYSLEEGSTILTFTPEYLNTLDVGKHTITFVYGDGSRIDAFLTVRMPEEKTEGSKVAVSCDHDYEWVEDEAATSVNDAKLVYKCKKCGDISLRMTEANSAFVTFNRDSADKITKASINGTAVIDTSTWTSFHRTVVDALAKRADVTLVINYTNAEHNRCQITIPAGTDLTDFIDANGYTGFEFLISKGLGTDYWAGKM